MIISGSKVKIILAWNSPIHWIVRLGITEAASAVKYRVLNLVFASAYGDIYLPLLLCLCIQMHSFAKF